MVQRVTPVGENTNFQPVSKFNIHSLPLHGILPKTQYRMII